MIFKNSIERQLRFEYGHRFNYAQNQTLDPIIVDTFECKRSQNYLLQTFNNEISPPFACDFSNQNPDFLIVSKEDGFVHIFDAENEGQFSSLAEFEAHPNAIFDVKWSHDDRSFFTASGDQSIRYFDVESRNCLQDFTGHSMSVKSICLNPQTDFIFASASRDGSVRIWDCRLSNPCFIVLSNCHTNYFKNSEAYKRNRFSSRILRKTNNNDSAYYDSHSVTCVKFFGENKFISSGSSDCSLKLWDMRNLTENSSRQKVTPTMTYTYKGLSQRFLGFSDISLNDSNTRMYALCKDSTIYEYDMTQMKNRPIFLYSDHVSNSFYIKMDISIDSNYLVCGSDGDRGVIYKIGEEHQNPIILPAKNVNEVSVAKWSKTCPTRIATLYDSAQVAIWNCYPARRYQPTTEQDDLYGMSYHSGVVKSQMEMKKNLLASPPPVTASQHKQHQETTPSRSMAESSGHRTSSQSCSSSGDFNSTIQTTPKRENNSSLLLTSFNQAAHTPPPSHVMSPLIRINRQLNISEFISSSSPPPSSSSLLPPKQAMSAKSTRRKTLIKRPRLNSSLFNIADESNKENISPHSFSRLIHNSDNEQDSKTSTPKRSSIFDESLSKKSESPFLTSEPIRPRKRLSLMTQPCDNENEVSERGREKKRRKTLFSSSRKQNTSPNSGNTSTVKSSKERQQKLLGIEAYFL